MTSLSQSATYSHCTVNCTCTTVQEASYTGVCYLPRCVSVSHAFSIPVGTAQLHDGSRSHSLFQWTGAAIVIVCYDVTSADSFRNCAKWLDMCSEAFGQRKLKGVLLGCKADVRDAIAVPTHVAHEYAVEHGLQHFECSAFEGKEVDTAFNYVADLFSRNYEAKLKWLQS